MQNKMVKGKTLVKNKIIINEGELILQFSVK